MKIHASFSIPASGNSKDHGTFEETDFKSLSHYYTTIDHYDLTRNCDCALRGYTDDEDADLLLKDVLRIICLLHDETVAEIVVSEKLIIKMEHHTDLENRNVRFHFYLHEKHLRFGNLMFLRAEDIV
ncbi:MAG TPA: hypothetical protein VGB50_10340 [Flavobacterium sp.]|jgi:hypothetical protein